MKITSPSLKGVGVRTMLCNYYAPTVPFIEPLSKVVAVFRGKMQQFCVCILIDSYITPTSLSPGPEVLK